MRKKKPEVMELGKAEQEAADDYLASKVAESQAEKKKKAAKQLLLEALGPYSSGILPDGRRVVKNVSQFPEGDFHRNAYETVALAIG
jgi:hypothetical protein